MNNLKISFLLFLRNISRRKISSLIILCSISVGIFISIMLFGFIQREKETDRFFGNSSNIFRLLSNDPFADSGTLSYITKNVAEYVNKYPEVENVCRVSELARGGVLIENNNQSLDGNMVVAVDKAFTDVFGLPVNKRNDLVFSKNSIVLTESLATKIFGNIDPIGKELVVNYDTLKFPLAVSAILNFDHENTHFEFDALVDFSLFDSYISGASIYLNLNQNVDIEGLENKMSIDPSMPSLVGPGKCSYFFQKLSDIYFDLSNRRPFTKTRDPNFIFISWIIILLISVIATFNFINLHALSLVDRQKEFGLKKIVGASFSKVSIGVGFEVFLFLTSGLLVSVVLLIFFIPTFNDFFNTQLSFSYFFNSHVLIGIITFFMILILTVSGIMSFLIQKIKPIRLINGQNKNGFKVNKLFFASQFFISSALIFCAINIIKQVNFIESKPLGFDRDIIEMKLPKGSSKSKMSLLKEELTKFSQINKSKLSVTSGNPISGNRIIRYDLGGDEFYTPYFMEGDEDLITTLGLEIEIGSQTNSKNGKIVNRKLVKYFNLADPIGKVLPGTIDQQIGSVVNDFNVASLKSEIPLYIIGYNEVGTRLLINFKEMNLEELKTVLLSTWTKVFPDYPFQYTIINDELLSKHKGDLFLSKLIVAFAFLSILISSFGLYSLAKSDCQSKEKEIAIRKSLGAPVTSIINLFLFDFGKWILFSFTLASVAGYFVIQDWLNKFAFHTNINWISYLLTALIVCVLSGIAVSNETIKSSLKNPVSSLHH